MKKQAIAMVLFVTASLTACSSASDTAGNSDSSSATLSAASTSDTAPPTTSDGAATAATSTPATTSDGTTAGTDPGSAYCTELRSAKAQYENLNFQALGGTQFRRLTAEFDSLAAAAPGAVKDDWATLSGALRQVQQILANAGLSFDDLKSLSSGQLPPGVKVKQLKKLTRQLQQFAQDNSYQQAADEIAAHAKSECGISMG